MSSDAHGDVCTCDKVNVGACKNYKNFYSFAVSQYSCDEFSTFLTLHELKLEAQQKAAAVGGTFVVIPDCHLCFPNVFEENKNDVNLEDGPKINTSPTDSPTDFPPVVVMSPPPVSTEIEEAIESLNMAATDSNDNNGSRSSGDVDHTHEVIYGGLLGGFLGLLVLFTGMK